MKERKYRNKIEQERKKLKRKLNDSENEKIK